MAGSSPLSVKARGKGGAGCAAAFFLLFAAFGLVFLVPFFIVPGLRVLAAVDVGLRGGVHDDVRLRLFDDARDLVGIGDVEVDEPRLLVAAVGAGRLPAEALVQTGPDQPGCTDDQNARGVASCVTASAATLPLTAHAHEVAGNKTPGASSPAGSSAFFTRRIWSTPS